MKRPHEEISRLEFDRLAKSIFPKASFVWDEVPQHLEPPDWYLTIDTIRYGVEATSIVDSFSVTPSSKLSAPNISASLFRFIDNVEQSAKKQGILSGAYIVTLSPIPNFAQNRERLSADLLNYIRETKSLQSAPEQVLGYVRQQRVSIKKEHNSKDYVSAGISMGVKWEGDAQNDLQQLVFSALADKASKLSAVSEPKILLLLDSYHYSFMADWSSVVSSCPDRVHFCCICRILPPDSSMVLWANTPKWQVAAAG